MVATESYDFQLPHHSLPLMLQNMTVKKTDARLHLASLNQDLLIRAQVYRIVQGFDIDFFDFTIELLL